MKRHTLPLPLLFALGVVGIGIALWSMGQNGQPITPRLPGVTEQPPAPPAHPLAGRYTFTYDNDSQARLHAGNAPMVGQTRLRGELRIEPTPDPTTLRLSLEAISQADITVGGSSLLADTDAAQALLLGHAALLKLDDDGRLAQVGFAADTPNAAQHVLQILATEAQITVRPGAAWQAIETTSQGVVPGDYTRDGAVIRRSRAAYQTLRMTQNPTPAGAVESRLIAHLDDGIESLEHSETINLADAEGLTQLSINTRLTLKRTAHVAPVSMPAVSALRDLDTVARSAQSSRQMLAARAAGMTPEQLVDDLLLFANSGTLPDHHRWLWRATGVLKLHPEHCANLIPLFGDSALNSKAKGLVLDLLVGAGHAPAQAALRTILDSDVARAQADHGLHIQRLGWLARPEPETVRYLLDRHSGGGARWAEAYALGASAGKLMQRGDAPVAQAALARLQDTLNNTTDPAERAHLITALGNAATDQATPTLADAANGAWQEREAAARALRAPQSPKNESLALQLVQDSERVVRASALRTLAGYDLDSGHVQRLTEWVQSGTLKGSEYPALVDLAVKHPELGPALSQMAQAMLPRAPADARLKMRIRALL